MIENINKIAQITLLFWLMKIIAKTLGETLGDHLAQTMQLGYLTGLGITFAGFVILLLLQLKAKTYQPILFWLVISATTTLGTEIADFIDRSLHLGYTIGSVVLFLGLVVTLYLRYRKYKSLSVFPIYEKSKEIYFWIAVLFSNSLGTSFGDYLSDVAGLSYLVGAMVTGLVILIVIVLHKAKQISPLLLFWLAFILTRPFGATFGYFLTKPMEKGGLDLGTLYASSVSIFLMIGLIYFEKQRRSTI